MPDNPSLNKRVLVVGALGVVLGFIAGFFFTNGINRGEQEKLRAELAAARAGARPPDAGKGQTASAPGGELSQSLTEEQIQNAVKKADQSPQDAELQKKVGQGLMLYASETSNASYL